MAHNCDDIDWICSCDRNCDFNFYIDWPGMNYEISDMRIECNRLKLFNDCEHFSEEMKKDLAKFGFYWTGLDDTVQCKFCQIRIYEWEPEDTALGEHRKHSPNCRFINGCNVSNIPLVEMHPPIPLRRQNPKRSNCYHKLNC
jgi:hypothetical protein